MTSSTPSTANSNIPDIGKTVVYEKKGVIWDTKITVEDIAKPGVKGFLNRMAKLFTGCNLFRENWGHAAYIKLAKEQPDLFESVSTASKTTGVGSGALSSTASSAATPTQDSTMVESLNAKETSYQKHIRSLGVVGKIFGYDSSVRTQADSLDRIVRSGEDLIGKTQGRGAQGIPSDYKSSRNDVMKEVKAYLANGTGDNAEDGKKLINSLSEKLTGPTYQEFKTMVEGVVAEVLEKNRDKAIIEMKEIIENGQNKTPTESVKLALRECVNNYLNNGTGDREKDTRTLLRTLAQEGIIKDPATKIGAATVNDVINEVIRPAGVGVEDKIDKKAVRYAIDDQAALAESQNSADLNQVQEARKKLTEAQKTFSKTPIAANEKALVEARRELQNTENEIGIKTIVNNYRTQSSGDDPKKLDDFLMDHIEARLAFISDNKEDATRYLISDLVKQGVINGANLSQNKLIVNAIAKHQGIESEALLQYTKVEIAQNEVDAARKSLEASESGDKTKLIAALKEKAEAYQALLLPVIANILQPENVTETYDPRSSELDQGILMYMSGYIDNEGVQTHFDPGAREQFLRNLVDQGVLTRDTDELNRAIAFKIGNVQRVNPNSVAILLDQLFLENEEAKKPIAQKRAEKQAAALDQIQSLLSSARSEGLFTGYIEPEELKGFVKTYLDNGTYGPKNTIENEFEKLKKALGLTESDKDKLASLETTKKLIIEDIKTDLSQRTKKAISIITPNLESTKITLTDLVANAQDWTPIEYGSNKEVQDAALAISNPFMGEVKKYRAVVDGQKAGLENQWAMLGSHAKELKDKFTTATSEKPLIDTFITFVSTQRTALLSHGTNEMLVSGTGANHTLYCPADQSKLVSLKTGESVLKAMEDARAVVIKRMRNGQPDGIGPPGGLVETMSRHFPEFNVAKFNGNEPSMRAMLEREVKTRQDKLSQGKLESWETKESYEHVIGAGTLLLQYMDNKSDTKLREKLKAYLDDIVFEKNGDIRLETDPVKIGQNGADRERTEELTELKQEGQEKDPATLLEELIGTVLDDSKAQRLLGANDRLKDWNYFTTERGITTGDKPALAVIPVMLGSACKADDIDAFDKGIVGMDDKSFINPMTHNEIAGVEVLSLNQLRRRAGLNKDGKLLFKEVSSDPNVGKVASRYPHEWMGTAFKLSLLQVANAFPDQPERIKEVLCQMAKEDQAAVFEEDHRDFQLNYVSYAKEMFVKDLKGLDGAEKDKKAYQILADDLGIPNVTAEVLEAMDAASKSEYQAQLDKRQE